MKQWLVTFRDSLLSTFPVVLIVCILFWTGISGLSNFEFILFIVSALLIFLGMSFFTKGTEQAMSKIGEEVGAHLTKSKNIFIIIILVFLLGLFVTVAEPDLSVVAEMTTNKWLIIILVGLGVGVFLVIGVLRIIFQKNLKTWLLAFYALAFGLAALINPRFIPFNFDAGGVTTGPMTVPFILALGLGIANTRGGKSSSSDSFGLTALCSIGPILVVMIITAILDENTGIYYEYVPTIIDTNEAILGSLNHAFFKSLMDVGIALAPIIVFFLVFNFIFIKLPKRELLKITVGLFYTYIGLVVFLTGVHGGFSPVAKILGTNLASNNDQLYLLVIVAFFLGLFALLCEPAVYVLIKQVEKTSDGMISKISMLLSLAIGVGVAIALSVIRIIFDFSIYYYLVPGYVMAFALTFLVPDIYTAIAFDSGGVASGPMTAAFILPFAVGISHQLEKDIVSQAFGVVSLVAMMPLIIIQLLGLSAILKQKRAYKLARLRIKEENDNQIIHFN